MIEDKGIRKAISALEALIIHLKYQVHKHYMSD